MLLAEHTGPDDRVAAIAAAGAPDDVRMQLLLAQTAIAVGNTSVAQASFQQAARLDPQSLDVFSEEASGAVSRPARGILAASARMRSE